MPERDAAERASDRGHVGLEPFAKRRAGEARRRARDRDAGGLDASDHLVRRRSVPRLGDVEAKRHAELLQPRDLARDEDLRHAGEAFEDVRDGARLRRAAPRHGATSQAASTIASMAASHPGRRRRKSASDLRSSVVARYQSPSGNLAPYPRSSPASARRAGPAVSPSRGRVIPAAKHAASTAGAAVQALSRSSSAIPPAASSSWLGSKSPWDVTRASSAGRVASSRSTSRSTRPESRGATRATTAALSAA